MFIAYVYRFPHCWATSEIGEITPGHYVQIEPVYSYTTSQEVFQKVEEMQRAGLRKVKDPGKKHESPISKALGYRSERAMQKVAHVWMLQFRDSQISALLFSGGKAVPLVQQTCPSFSEVRALVDSYPYSGAA